MTVDEDLDKMITFVQSSGRYRCVVPRAGMEPAVMWADNRVEARGLVADHLQRGHGPAKVRGPRTRWGDGQ